MISWLISDMFICSTFTVYNLIDQWAKMSLYEQQFSSTSFIKLVLQGFLSFLSEANWVLSLS